MPFDVEAARCQAAKLLTHGSDAWLHAHASACRAEQVAVVVGPADRDLLICAAWLHDVGFAPAAVRTGYPALDGAVLLRDAGWPARLVALVAHHGESPVTAASLGLEGELRAFRREDGPVADALVFADMAAGLDGRRMSLRGRLDEIDRRYASDPPELRAAWEQRRAALVAAVARTEQRLAGAHRCRARAGV